VAARTARPTQTPALSLVYMLARQLARVDEAGGVETRWSRHHALLAALERWAGSREGVSLLAGAGERSWAVSALTLGSEVDVWRIVREMHRRGWLLTGGLGALADRVLRIGHMGDLTPAHLEAMLADLATLV
jgi:aspartate aminotransferase-like enzyme